VFPSTVPPITIAYPFTTPSITENSIPAIPLSAMRKFLKITAPVLSIIAPLRPHFHATRSSKTAVTYGFFQ
jgi:hypothetical protein